MFSKMLMPKLATITTAEINNVNELEARVSTLSEAIKDSYLASCPMKKLRPERKGTVWWNADIAFSKKQVRKYYRAAMLENNDENWKQYRKARIAFNTQIREAKNLAKISAPI